jgi:hypothetical protein
MPPSSFLLHGKYLPFSPSPSPLRLNIFRLFVILSLTQLYRYTPEIFLFLTAKFKYTYRAPLRRIGHEYSANVAWSTFQSLKRIQPLPVQKTLIVNRTPIGRSAKGHKGQNESEKDNMVISSM